MRKIQHPFLILGRMYCCEHPPRILIYSHYRQISTIPEKKKRGGKMSDPCQGNVFQQQLRRCGELSDFMYFECAQTKLFWREMKIILQCMLKFNTFKSLAMT